ncbi:hypothetical protein [Paenibacillus sp. SI8]|uniref:hypothetical protein n=1 Tax=unclassified Paenibacillus TaxID=185978 RepID=UPI003467EAC3
MRNINLLPRKPAWDLYILPLIIVLLIVAVVPVAVTSYLYIVNRNEMVKVRGNIAELAQRVTEKEQSLKADPATISYQNLSKIVQTLKTQRTDWIPKLNLLAEQLPSKALIKDMNVLAPETITVHDEFYKHSEIIEYVTRLQQSPLVSEVKVVSIIRENPGESLSKPAASVKNTAKESPSFTVFHVNLTVLFRPDVGKQEGK